MAIATAQRGTGLPLTPVHAEGRLYTESESADFNLAADDQTNVLVMDRGRIAFKGTPGQLTQAATGQVWIADQRDSTARAVWRTGEGHYRHIGNLGNPPSGATTIDPTIEDGYLLLVGNPAIVEEQPP